MLIMAWDSYAMEVTQKELNMANLSRKEESWASA